MSHSTRGELYQEALKRIAELEQQIAEERAITSDMAVDIRCQALKKENARLKEQVRELVEYLNREAKSEPMVSSAEILRRIQPFIIRNLSSKNHRLREALLNLNAAIDYHWDDSTFHWDDSFTGVQRMPDAHAKMIVAAQQVAKKALEAGDE